MKAKPVPDTPDAPAGELSWEELAEQLWERDRDPAYASAPVLDAYARISFNPVTGVLEKTDRQLVDCLLGIRARHARLGEVLRDDDKSATKRHCPDFCERCKRLRPDWARLIGRLESGAAQGVQCWHTDRLLRQPWDLERLIWYADKGLLVGSCYGDYALDDADQRFTLRILTARAAAESDAISRRQKRKKQALRQQGRLTTGGARGFGFPGAVRMPKNAADAFRRAEQSIPQVPGDQVAAEREAIAKGTQDHLDGVTLAAIATEWNTWPDVQSLIWTSDAADGEVALVDGLRTATGGLHNELTVRTILSRASNAGLIEHAGVIVGKAKDDDGNLLVPIVAEEQWSQIRAVFASRSVGRPVTGVNLLSGILRCALCGTGLVSKAKGGKYYPDGTAVRRYLCNNKPACGKVIIDQRRADGMVRELTITRLADPRHAEQIKQRSKAVAELDAKIADAETTAREVGARLGEGKITLDRHDAIMEPLDRRLAKLRADRDALLEQTGASAPSAAAGLSESTALTDLDSQWGDDEDNATPEQIAEANQRRRALIGKAFPLGLAVTPATARGGGRFDTDRIKPIHRKRPTTAA